MSPTIPTKEELRAAIEAITDQFTEPGIKYLKDLNNQLLALFAEEREKFIGELLNKRVKVLYVASEKDKSIYSEKPSEAVPVKNIVALLTEYRSKS